MHLLQKELSPRLLLWSIPGEHQPLSALVPLVGRKRGHMQGINPFHINSFSEASFGQTFHWHHFNISHHSNSIILRTNT